MSAWLAIYSDGSEVPLGVARPSTGQWHQWRPSGPHSYTMPPSLSLGHDTCKTCSLCGVSRCEEPSEYCEGKRG